MSLSRWVRFLHRPVITSSITILGVLLCCIGLVSLAAYQSTAAVTALQKGQFETARLLAKQSTPIVAVTNAVTLGLIPDVSLWNNALSIPGNIEDLVITATNIAETSMTGESQVGLLELLPHLQSLRDSVALIERDLPRTIVVRKKVPPETTKMVTQLSTGLTDIEHLVTALSSGDNTWVVILQNSEELRATGGFPGSYVLLNMNDGVLREMVVEDIYDADGQFKGYISAPTGIKEYTSGEKGLRLPDANWWPDFPKSAQTMLQFFALGDKKNIAGLVAINLDTARSILEVTGPIWLPDYNIEVTDKNIGEVLRSERSEFFPGSTQKKHLLSLTLIQLKQKIAELSPEQKFVLVQKLFENIQNKNVQFYSTNPDIQSLFSEYHLSGEITVPAFTPACACTPVLLALIESNVGINKVNRYVTRSNSVSVDADQFTVTTTFTNQSAPLTSTELSSLLKAPVESQPRNGNGYLNYYRLIISPEYSVNSIKVGNTILATWDEELLKTTSGQEIKQIGVLIAVPEQRSTVVTFSLQTSNTDTPKAVQLIKQSGLPPTQYTFQTPESMHEVLLETDQLVAL